MNSIYSFKTTLTNFSQNFENKYNEVQFSFSCDNQEMKLACVVLHEFSCFTCSSHVFRCTSYIDGFSISVSRMVTCLNQQSVCSSSDTFWGNTVLFPVFSFCMALNTKNVQDVVYLPW